ncbi:sensor histidine kinase [Streptomyces lydicamycinicus]|uniref:sensor histidine kinase n=1 Tax=Streptomyces lydicamycinicus TaxID=1546107 RepID=UPI0032DF10DF
MCRPSLAEHVVAVLGEALSNAARHAHATTVEVSLAVGGGALSLSVTDNGVGMPRDGRRSGLSNLAKRAASVGGEMTLAAPAQGGTLLLWQAPLPSA